MDGVAGSQQEMEQLVQAFIARSLSKESWTHEAHLLVAIWHLKTYSKWEATCLLRSRIMVYNEKVGTENSATSGYHETLTLFWIWVVGGFLQKNEGFFPDLAKRFFQSPYAKRDLPLFFFTRERLFSVEARAVWVDPDINSLNFDKIK